MLTMSDNEKSATVHQKACDLTPREWATATTELLTLSQAVVRAQEGNRSAKDAKETEARKRL